MKRREFIAGCVAAGVGAGLPAVKQRLFDPHIFYFKEVVATSVYGSGVRNTHLLCLTDGRVFECSHEMHKHYWLWFGSGRNEYGGNMPTTGCRLIRGAA